MASPADLESSPAFGCSQSLASDFALSSSATLHGVAVGSAAAAFAILVVSVASVAPVALAALEDCALPVGCAASVPSFFAGGWAKSGLDAAEVLPAGAGGDCGACEAGACAPSSSRLSNGVSLARAELCGACA